MPGRRVVGRPEADLRAPSRTGDGGSDEVQPGEGATPDDADIAQVPRHRIGHGRLEGGDEMRARRLAGHDGRRAAGRWCRPYGGEPPGHEDGPGHEDQCDDQRPDDQRPPGHPPPRRSVVGRRSLVGDTEPAITPLGAERPPAGGRLPGEVELQRLLVPGTSGRVGPHPGRSHQMRSTASQWGALGLTVARTIPWAKLRGPPGRPRGGRRCPLSRGPRWW